MTKVLCKITCILALIFNVRLAVAQAGDLPHSTPHQPAVIKAPAMPHPGPVAAAAIQAIAGHVPAAKPNVLSIVHQQIMIHGHPLHYTITSGYMPMTNRSGKLLARIFFIAYTKDVAAGRKAARPLTFAFNGGPGAAAGTSERGLPLQAARSRAPAAQATNLETTLIDTPDRETLSPHHLSFTDRTARPHS